MELLKIKESDLKGDCYRLNSILKRMADFIGLTSGSSDTATAAASSSGTTAQIAYATSGLTLTTVFTQIPGCTLTLPAAGPYLIFGFFDFSGSGAGDANSFALGQLIADGVAQAGQALFAELVLAGAGLTGSPVPMACSVGQQWMYTAAAPGKVVGLRVNKNGGTGASGVGTRSSISAIRLSA